MNSSCFFQFFYLIITFSKHFERLSENNWIVSSHLFYSSLIMTIKLDKELKNMEIYYDSQANLGNFILNEPTIFLAKFEINEKLLPEKEIYFQVRINLRKIIIK